ncbi:hypothetical protein [Paenibacillus sedimenti]|uniref:Lipoprotein n=1 Tax=Paenibacillus sedimenti TaxID=2770274 RepID=A0A926KXU5_9BACL|nr:hypothetical protein [Paenibacillus sedimenti]MBD0384119.1 hypothetical protein [Paenibacillus sedimenti]
MEKDVDRSMKAKWIYGTASLILLGALTTACGSKDETEITGASGSKVTTTTVAQISADSSVKTVPSGAKPAIEATVTQDGRNATITYTTTNFNLSDYKDQKNVQGQGHLHLYVDGKQKAMLTQNAPVKLTNLAVGNHEIRLKLQQNDHTDLNVEKILNIEVKK